MKEDRELAAQLFAIGDVKIQQIAEKVGVDRKTLQRWRKDASFAARVEEIKKQQPGHEDSAKTSDKPLSPQAEQYVANRLEGKSKYRSAVDAGYSDSTARNAHSLIEGQPSIRRRLQALLAEKCPVETLTDRIKEGLDSVRQVVVGDGMGAAHVEQYPDMRERREYVKLALTLQGGMDDESTATSETAVEVEADDVRQKLRIRLLSRSTTRTS